MKYQEALLTAYAVMKEIRPSCRKIEIAGDIRRRCPEIRSIELLAISREEDLFNLFGEAIAPYLLIEDWVHSCGLRFAKNGPKYKRFKWRDIWVDLYVTSEYQWGLQMALRTGCRQFASWLTTPRRKGGALPGYMKIAEGWLWMNGHQIPTLTEPNFFAAIEAEWIRPDLRTAKVWRN